MSLACFRVVTHPHGQPPHLNVPDDNAHVLLAMALKDMLDLLQVFDSLSGT